MIRLPETSRRGLIAGVAGTVFAATGAAALAAKGKNQENEVGAVEDLMREHGVLRRALLVYRESAAKLRANASVDPKPIQQTAQLFRNFGEDYHERKLEEVPQRARERSRAQINDRPFRASESDRIRLTDRQP